MYCCDEVSFVVGQSVSCMNSVHTVSLMQCQPWMKYVYGTMLCCLFRHGDCHQHGQYSVCWHIVVYYPHAIPDGVYYPQWYPLSPMVSTIPIHVLLLSPSVTLLSPVCDSTIPDGHDLRLCQRVQYLSICSMVMSTSMRSGVHLVLLCSVVLLRLVVLYSRCELMMILTCCKY